MGTGSSFPVVEVAEAWSWPPTSQQFVPTILKPRSPVQGGWRFFEKNAQTEHRFNPIHRRTLPPPPPTVTTLSSLVYSSMNSFSLRNCNIRNLHQFHSYFHVESRFTNQWMWRLRGALICWQVYITAGAGIATALRAGRLRDRSSSPGRDKIFLLFMSSRPFLGPTQSPI
jgi:hypothetical protein